MSALTSQLGDTHSAQGGPRSPVPRPEPARLTTDPHFTKENRHERLETELILWVTSRKRGQSRGRGLLQRRQRTPPRGPGPNRQQPRPQGARREGSQSCARPGKDTHGSQSSGSAPRHPNHNLPEGLPCPPIFQVNTLKSQHSLGGSS